MHKISTACDWAYISQAPVQSSFANNLGGVLQQLIKPARASVCIGRHADKRRHRERVCGGELLLENGMSNKIEDLESRGYLLEGGWVVVGDIHEDSERRLGQERRHSILVVH